jgi:hypothetical protein
MLAEGMGVGIREDVDAVVPVDRANLAARVSAAGACAQSDGCCGRVRADPP